MSQHLCNDFGLYKIAQHFGKTSALDIYYEGSQRELSGDVDGAIILYRRAFRLWPGRNNKHD